MPTDTDAAMSLEAWTDAFYHALKAAAASTGDRRKIVLAEEMGLSIGRDYYDNYIEATFSDPAEAAQFEVDCWAYMPKDNGQH
jgi:hypothetical protein